MSSLSSNRLNDLFQILKVIFFFFSFSFFFLISFSLSFCQIENYSIKEMNKEIKSVFNEIEYYKVTFTLNLLLINDLIPRIQVTFISFLFFLLFEILIFLLEISQRIYALGILYSIHSNKSTHPFLSTFLDIIEYSHSDIVEKQFISICLFIPSSRTVLYHLLYFQFPPPHLSSFLINDIGSLQEETN